MESPMQITKHGLAIGFERVNNDFILTLKAEGKLTHEDYGTITPFIDSALSAVEHPNVKVFIDGTELDGWEPRAAWDDFKLGLKHGNAFEKVAIYGNKGWQEKVSKIASWFISGEVKYFEDQQEALRWLDS